MRLEFTAIFFVDTRGVLLDTACLKQVVQHYNIKQNT
jgi:hypothetical protein